MSVVYSTSLTKLCTVMESDPKAKCEEGAGAPQNEVLGSPEASRALVSALEQLKMDRGST